MSHSGLEKLLKHYRNFVIQKEEEINKGLHDYCLLTSVLPANDEVRLHTRFIYSMINPDGLHYKGREFLEVFLQQLPKPLQGFINLEQAVVEREKDNIDLFIHDGEHYLIIENKLDAGDQPFQISRYIRDVRQKYLPECQDVSNNIAVVYLSKSKTKPSKDSNSLAGFKLVNQQLIWQGLTDAGSIKKLEGINLTKGQAIAFVHMGYSQAIEAWAKECMAFAPDGINSAFEDYLAVLQRINNPSTWKKVMTLDQYVLGLNEQDQKETYEFMVEAQKSLVDFVAIKLHQELLHIFNSGDSKTNTSLVACDGHPRSITPQTIKKWLNKTGNKKHWSNIACSMQGKTGAKIGLLLGVNYASLSVLDADGKVDYSQNNRVGEGFARAKLLAKNGVYDFVKDIENKLTELGHG